MSALPDNRLPEELFDALAALVRVSASTLDAIAAMRSPDAPALLEDIARQARRLTSDPSALAEAAEAHRERDRAAFADAVDGLRAGLVTAADWTFGGKGGYLGPVPPIGVPAGAVDRDIIRLARARCAQLVDRVELLSADGGELGRAVGTLVASDLALLYRLLCVADRSSDEASPEAAR